MKEAWFYFKNKDFNIKKLNCLVYKLQNNL